MEKLLHLLSLAKITPIVQKHHDNFLELPLYQWIQEIEKLESEAQNIFRQAEAKQRKGEAKLEADNKSLLASLQASSFEDTKETLQEAMKQSTKEMAEWLARHRLSRYAGSILKIAGMYVSVSHNA